ncbi:MAG: AMP-binding protein [Methylobacteriaceae bacterium]|nr:AMP-binding protein [Methylobacteriaceae bacterium]
MSAHFDRLETRSPQSRELALYRNLKAILGIARHRAPALRAQLKGVDLAALGNAAALAGVPVMHKSDLTRLQKEARPFGGLAATRPGALKRLLISPGPIFEPEGQAKDWWGAARALHAAGLRKGAVVLNCFSYHLTPGGHIMESGAHAIGAAVIPAGVGATEQQLDAIEHLHPDFYCGTPDFLKILLDKGRESGRDVGSIRRALVSGAALPPSLRAELESRGVGVMQAYATADCGVIAYETRDAAERLAPGMMVNEGLIVEIVRPGTGDPVEPGEVGEVVVTRLNADYPLLRFATGDMTKALPGPSPCGRTNMRIAGWLGRADQTAKVKGMFVHPSQVAEIGKRHPELGRLRLIVTRANEQDQMRLKAEMRNGAASDALTQRIEQTLQSVTKLRGAVELVAAGALPNDGKIIADERPVG